MNSTLAAGFSQVWVTVPGEPVAKERPRVTRRGTYTPPKTAHAEQVMAWKFRQAAPHHKPAPKVGYGLYCEFYFSHWQGKTDLDNLVKLVRDALNKVAWPDDRQVDEVCGRRFVDRAEPRTVLCVYPLGEPLPGRPAV